MEEASVVAIASVSQNEIPAAKAGVAPKGLSTFGTRDFDTQRKAAAEVVNRVEPLVCALCARTAEDRRIDRHDAVALPTVSRIYRLAESMERQGLQKPLRLAKPMKEGRAVHLRKPALARKLCSSLQAGIRHRDQQQCPQKRLSAHNPSPPHQSSVIYC